MVCPTEPKKSPTPPGSVQFLSDEQRRASMLQALAGWSGHHDLWIYAYGSLIWNPEFDYEERRLSVLRGHHRALCLWSRVNRGTPETPGLVFGLDRGGSCRGLTFRIRANNVPSTFEALWRREMSTGAYHPRWLRCDTEKGQVSALAFVIDRKNPGYVTGLAENQTLDIVRQASGRYGPCVDYVVQTHQALKAAGIEDQRLARLAQRLQEQLDNDRR
ncbi:MAG: gamma-glutamylcyclotransferase [Burkholderiaceae bacterium]|nr:gamma-glutamylcyclotransferase [Burkholderiaceae bacterium]MCD8516587.1 gamma-glutamylcyclotransferase [Burkholderiaceae bacterium]MCD8537301.1 gamma-glutamylcyclotransferase [Burkholderiaceae bacterium]MCD8565189.1 gamma-glutamylcyclotransferase [Burkholderiaceae bacterium]